MEKTKIKCGLIAYKTTPEEIFSIGGLGICDECGKSPDYGYLVPVLNHWQCPDCFNDWQSRAKHYPEDDRIEKRNAMYYEGCIPVRKDETNAS